MSVYRRGEFHEFSGGDKSYLYLVPSGGIFAPDDLSKSLLKLLETDGLSRAEIVTQLRSDKYSAFELEECIDELHGAQAIVLDTDVTDLPTQIPEQFPLQTAVLNVTNQCNLSCSYCYEYGEDRIASSEGKTKFMEEETARQAIDLLFEQSHDRRSVHVTFFGGETLLNFEVVKSAVEYARKRAAETGKYVDFSMTTNATMLTEEIIEFLVKNNIGVTVSIDGPKESNDRFRVFQGGKGSYDVIAPKIRELLKTHRGRPIGARVTLTAQVVNVKAIFRHLTEEMGFTEVGFAPVTTSPVRLYAIGSNGLDDILTQFAELAEEYLAHALRNEHHGFSNISDTLQELHHGVSKAYPCGAGLGLIGVSPSGDLGLCHRFVDSEAGLIGHLNTGIDRTAQRAHLTSGHINNKYDCHTCWARPVCSGGCYHEAFVRYGDTSRPNLHYCDWIRGWTDVCLRVYGEIAARNPDYLKRFEDRKVA
ncbi:MAG: quinohemoprotein amine dehydrogenase maturation protein [Blastocatellia bacterium AA13]|nr:MAG: quinohemoprotein amine dehydrogenase maturation protein [Blastocatellia bacterium AA13]